MGYCRMRCCCLGRILWDRAVVTAQDMAHASISRHQQGCHPIGLTVRRCRGTRRGEQQTCYGCHELRLGQGKCCNSRKGANGNGTITIHAA